MTRSEVEELVVRFYKVWKAAGWPNDPEWLGPPEVREIYDQIGEQIPGRDLARPIKERVLPKVSAIAVPKQVIHIISRHGLILGRCLQGRPHTWPAHHWTVPWAERHNATCEVCLSMCKGTP